MEFPEHTYYPDHHPQKEMKVWRDQIYYDLDDLQGFDLHYHHVVVQECAQGPKVHQEPDHEYQSQHPHNHHSLHPEKCYTHLLGGVSIEEQLRTMRRRESLGTKFNSKVSSTDDTCYLYTREPR